MSPTAAAGIRLELFGSPGGWTLAASVKGRVVGRHQVAQLADTEDLQVALVDAVLDAGAPPYITADVGERFAAIVASTDRATRCRCPSTPTSWAWTPGERWVGRDGVCTTCARMSPDEVLVECVLSRHLVTAARERLARRAA